MTDEKTVRDLLDDAYETLDAALDRVGARSDEDIPALWEVLAATVSALATQNEAIAQIADQIGIPHRAAGLEGQAEPGDPAVGA